MCDAIGSPSILTEITFSDKVVYTGASVYPLECEFSPVVITGCTGEIWNYSIDQSSLTVADSLYDIVNINPIDNIVIIDVLDSTNPPT